MLERARRGQVAPIAKDWQLCAPRPLARPSRSSDQHDDRPMAVPRLQSWSPRQAFAESKPSPRSAEEAPPAPPPRYVADARDCPALCLRDGRAQSQDMATDPWGQTALRAGGPLPRGKRRQGAAPSSAATRLGPTIPPPGGGGTPGCIACFPKHLNPLSRA